MNEFSNKKHSKYFSMKLLVNTVRHFLLLNSLKNNFTNFFMRFFRKIRKNEKIIFFGTKQKGVTGGNLSNFYQNSKSFGMKSIIGTFELGV